MKKMNLNAYGVQKMERNEMKKVKGRGFWWFRLSGGINFVRLNPEYWRSSMQA